MPYYTKVLQAGETVRYLGRLHWLIYAVSIAFAALAAAFAVMAVAVFDPANQLAVGVCAALALVFLAVAALRTVRSFIRQRSTEIVVTDRRVIFKTGWISRHTVEMNISKIETVDVDQPLVGRFLGYGTVSVRGTGAGLEPMRSVADPLRLRNAILVG